MNKASVLRTVTQMMKQAQKPVSMGKKPPKSAAPRPTTHVKARCETYPRNQEIKKYNVPDDFVSWDVMFEKYQPVEYTAPSIEAKPVYADPDYKYDNDVPENKKAKWNLLDGNIDRRSFHGTYMEVDGLPRNPVGRTGVCCRGLLGRWGPNHAADPIVTRWKRDEKKKIIKHDTTNKPLLEFIAIQRWDSKEWAIPGGMVDAGENVSTTLKREFSEETMNLLDATTVERAKIRDNVRNLFKCGVEGMVSAGESVSETLKREFSEEAMNSLVTESQEELNLIKKQVKALFKGGKEVYRGYVDDPRNTDNAWMETVAVNFHDETGESVGRFKLHAGDDAVGVMWHDMNSSIKLYASHVDFCEKVADLHKAHW